MLYPSRTVVMVAILMMVMIIKMIAMVALLTTTIKIFCTAWRTGKVECFDDGVVDVDVNHDNVNDDPHDRFVVDGVGGINGRTCRRVICFEILSRAMMVS